MSEQGRPKVVNLNQRRARDEQSGDRLGHLIKSCRDISRTHIRQLVDGLFDNIDDALFDLAEKSETNQAQTRYFEGMREVRRKRRLVERVFLDEVSQRFGSYSRGELKAPSSELDSSTAGGVLSIVEDEELEERLAIDEMVSKAEARQKNALYAVNERFSVAIGGAPVSDQTNPVGPAQLCDAMRTAAADFDVDIAVKLIVYKLFDRYVMAGLPRLYDELNARLIEKGILPKLSMAPGARQRAPAPPPPSRTAPTADMGAETAGPVYHDHGPQMTSAQAVAENAIYQTIWNLISARTQAPRSGGAVATTGAPAHSGTRGSDAGYATSDLLAALSALQFETQTRGLEAQIELGKQALLDRVAATTDASASVIDGADEATIDLVALVFEYIQDDKDIPDPIQAALSRLQIPYLKAALMDRHFFAQKSHPARTLLDQLADAGKGWSSQADRNHLLLGKIKDVVSRLLSEFDESLHIFDELREEFSDFRRDQERRASAAERRAAEAAEGKEKLDAARRTAAREILERTRESELPEVVEGILTRPWANVLVLTQLRHGPDSDEYLSALHVADRLVWSGTPKRNDNERAQLARESGDIEDALRKGLKLVAYHDSDTEILISDLRACYDELLTGEAVDRPADASTNGSSALPDIGFVEQLDLDEDPNATADTDNLDQKVVTWVKQFKSGDWFEFREGEQEPQRAKLSWVSPISSRYLFVNQRGQKFADLALDELVRGVASRRVRIIQNAPLMDRALGAIARKLSKEQAEPA